MNNIYATTNTYMVIINSILHTPLNVFLKQLHQKLSKLAIFAKNSTGLLIIVVHPYSNSLINNSLYNNISIYNNIYIYNGGDM